MLCSAIEHHAVLDAMEWLRTAEGADVELLPVDDKGRLRRRRRCARRSSGTRHRSSLVSVMWANNEVGTLQPIDEVVAIAAEHGIPVHTDAVQAVGTVPVDFAASGVDALTLTGHKLGGPYGVGALVVRREVVVTPLLHGGGQERDVRCGTLDTPAIAGFAAAVELAVKQQPERAARIGGAARRPGRRVVEVVPDAHLHGAALDPLGVHRLPGNAHLGVPRLRGRLAAHAARRPRHRVLDRLGLLGRRTPALARPAGDGLRRRPARGTRCGSRSATPRPRPTSTPSSRRSDPRSNARGRSGRGDPGMKVLAAMSGGVDSAVAAARAVDAGHDVTGVHLALSRNPASYRSGARGCCTIEDANDARRAADVIGIPFYVWDLSERFHEDVVEDFVDEYAAGRTPNPCLRCNEKIKFAAVLDRALALGFDAVATGHYAQLRTGPDGLVEMHRAVDDGKDQSYVLGVLDQDQLRARRVPARRLDQDRGARRGGRARAARRRQAGQPRHLLRRGRRHLRLAAREAGRPRAEPGGRDRGRVRRRRSGHTRAPTASPSASARGSGSAGRRRTASRGSCSTSSRCPGPSPSARGSGWRCTG